MDATQQKESLAVEEEEEEGFFSLPPRHKELMTGRLPAV